MAAKTDRQTAFLAIQSALKVLGWEFALIDDGAKPGTPCHGMIIGTRKYIEAVSEPGSTVEVKL